MNRYNYVPTQAIAWDKSARNVGRSEMQLLSYII